MKKTLSLLIAVVALLAAGCSVETTPSTNTGGQCSAPGTSYCEANATQPAPYCASLLIDNNNCGLCGQVCQAGLTCTNGACVCPAGKTSCNGVCVDLQSDTNNCGFCGTSCGGQFCNSGSCSADCGLTVCAEAAGNVCVDTASSEDHCGTCNNACPVGSSCNGTGCACDSGQALCGGVCCAAGSTCNGTSCVAPAVDVGGAGAGNTAGTGVVDNTAGTANVTAGTGVVDNTAGTVTVDPAAGAANVAGAGGDNPAAGTGGNDPTAGMTGVDMSGGDPPGYWRYADWGGCAWTGVDTTNSGTTATPQDFLTNTGGDPYCISGTVGANDDYESVALLGFNLNQAPEGSDQCVYKPVVEGEVGPPGVTLSGSGIAANIVKRGDDTSFTFRIQLQGPNGADDENDRWCATIEAVGGKFFVPYDNFNTKCWDDSGNAYNGEPISAVVFLVPGDPVATPYDFCVNGFAAGSSANDAPDGTAVAGDLKGVVGSNAPDGDFERAKVLVDGEEYIIQNNNWGRPDSTDLILNYVNNSFKIASGTGTGGDGQGVPSSFPSIYIGANGYTANGVMATSNTDNLPKQISQINSIQTSFRWSGSTDSFNATYDVWFANSPPSGEYKDGIDGFVMVWLYKPGDAQPIGSQTGTANIAGNTWQVWTGPRGDGPDGYNSAPVVSYVATASLNSLSFDLKNFIDDAVQNHGLGSNVYLTDVFAGFEIWRGGAGGNLGVDEFTCKVE